MRKQLPLTEGIFPMPVLMVATYNEDGTVNVMNAAWGTMQERDTVALDLREAHKDDFFSVPEDNPLEDFLQTAEETASPNSDPEQAAMAFICKRLKLNYGKLSEEEKKWLKRIAQKSDLLKNPNPQRGRK